MGWYAKLDVKYHQNSQQKTLAHYEHTGPLRILQSLYPEGDDICHNVLVHPPGGIVGGDTLDISLDVAPQAHSLITTPGATRFYRSEGDTATQTVHAHVHPHARLEWLPLETIAYSGCNGVNRSVFELAPQAQLMTWEMLTLGLPHANQPFEKGTIAQHLEIKDHWLDRGLISADDRLLLTSPLGLNHQTCIGTFVLAWGDAPTPSTLAHALDLARACMDEQNNQHFVAGATCPNAQTVVVRTLSQVTEPAQKLFRKIWAQWRKNIWHIDNQEPRLWAL